MYDQLPAVTKAEVDRVRPVWAHKYPIAADAAKAGWWKSMRSLYGIGAAPDRPPVRRRRTRRQEVEPLALTAYSCAIG